MEVTTVTNRSKSKEESPYVRSPNFKYFVNIPQELAQSTVLSMEAIGLMTYILSLPPDWEFYNSHLMKHARMGRKKFDRVIREIKAEGYMHRTFRQGEKGKMAGWVTMFSNYPEFKESNRLCQKGTFGEKQTSAPIVPKSDSRKKEQYINKTLRDKKYINNNSKTSLKEEGEYFTKAQSSVVVDLTYLVKIVDGYGGRISKQLLAEYVTNVGSERLKELITQAYTDNAIKKPEPWLRKAVKQNFMPSTEKQSAAAPSRPLTTAEEEVIVQEVAVLWRTMPQEELKNLLDYVRRKWFVFDHLTQEVDVLSEDFVNHHTFKDVAKMLSGHKCHKFLKI